jgi:signal transduction histidine kinase
VAFCSHAILEPDLFIIPDAQADERFADHPFVASDPYIRFYAGAPLVTPEGHALGTICAIDRVPHELTPEQRETLRALARQAMTQLRLRRSLKQLRELEALREDLMHMIVHDLRTPLTSFIGGLETVELLGELNPEQKQCLQVSRQGGNTLLRMVNDLLDLARLEQGALPLKYEPLEAENVLDEAWKQVEHLASLKQVRLAKAVVPELPVLEADRDKLVRTLVNLLGNAVKFSPEGGTVSAAARLDGRTNAIRFSVTDTGEGIPAEAHDQIFEKFGQVKTRQSGQGSAGGLGLVFCKMVVEAHHGRIWVESELGKGSTFSLVLPLTRKT